jgi:DNA-binding MarR family transcriptional regulator
MTAQKARGDDVVGDATEAVLMLSRALVGVAARSLSATEDRVTLVQYRALVLLGAKGPQKVGTLADELGIHPSTATRLCDRLTLNGFIARATSTQSRREVTLQLSDAGRALVRAETSRRRRAIREIVERLDHDMQAQLVDIFGALTEAAAIGPEQAWRLGWTA